MNSIVEWRPVPGWEGLYEVSSDGQVRSLPRRVVRRNGTVQNFKGKLLSPALNSCGYPCARLSDDVNGRREYQRVHRLVGQAFIENPSSLPQINHKNGCKSDNRVENLEWTDDKGNRTHAWRIDLRTRKHLPIKRGEDNPIAKLTERDVLEARRERYEIGTPFRRIAERFGVSKKTIQYAISGRSWAHVLPPGPEGQG